jgi:AraC-like DNA-binding protein
MPPPDFGPRFRAITPGIERLRSSFSLPRHRHLHAYATVVLGGRYEESGYVGRIGTTAGDVLIHPALDCHENISVSAGVQLIRLPWPDRTGVGGLYRIDAIDEVARAAERDTAEATHLLQRALASACAAPPGQRNDWPDVLLRDLARNPSTELRLWAETKDLAPETLSRGFSAAYGVTPSIVRAELRTRQAWLRITRGTDPLATVAAETGFADQAHMTRWIRRMTGSSPAAWRRGQSAFVVRAPIPASDSGAGPRSD